MARLRWRYWARSSRSPGGAASALKVRAFLGRNFPLVLLLVMIGALFWPSPQSEQAEEEIEVRKPNGSDHFPSSLRH